MRGGAAALRAVDRIRRDLVDKSDKSESDSSSDSLLSWWTKVSQIPGQGRRGGWAECPVVERQHYGQKYPPTMDRQAGGYFCRALVCRVYFCRACESERLDPGHGKPIRACCGCCRGKSRPHRTAN